MTFIGYRQKPYQKPNTHIGPIPAMCPPTKENHLQGGDRTERRVEMTYGKTAIVLYLFLISLVCMNHCFAQEDLSFAGVENTENQEFLEQRLQTTTVQVNVNTVAAEAGIKQKNYRIFVLADIDYHSEYFKNKRSTIKRFVPPYVSYNEYISLRTSLEWGYVRGPSDLYDKVYDHFRQWMEPRTLGTKFVSAFTGPKWNQGMFARAKYFED